jgi:hypothetical protein
MTRLVIRIGYIRFLERHVRKETLMHVGEEPMEESYHGSTYKKAAESMTY